MSDSDFESGYHKHRTRRGDYKLLPEKDIPKQRRQGPKTMSVTGIRKRNAWLDEVRAIWQEIKGQPGKTYKDALNLASERRKEQLSGYRSIKEEKKITDDEQYDEYQKTGLARNVYRYKGRQFDPSKKGERGNYSRKPIPYSHKNKRLFTTKAAVKHLRDYYGSLIDQGVFYDRFDGTQYMRKNISSKQTRRDRALSPVRPCPTRKIKVKRGGKTFTREIMESVKKLRDENHPCLDNWKYRTPATDKFEYGKGPGDYDMLEVDYGVGKDSLAYGIRTLYDTRESRKKKDKTARTGRKTRLSRRSRSSSRRSRSSSPSTARSRSTSPSTARSRSTSPSTARSRSSSPSTARSRSSSARSRSSSPSTTRSRSSSKGSKRSTSSKGSTSSKASKRSTSSKGSKRSMKGGFPQGFGGTLLGEIEQSEAPPIERRQAHEKLSALSLNNMSSDSERSQHSTDSESDISDIGSFTYSE